MCAFVTFWISDDQLARMEGIWRADAVVNFSSFPCLFWTHHRSRSTRLPCRRPRASQQRTISSMRDSSTRLLLPRWAHHSFWWGCHLYLPFYVSVRWLVQHRFGCSANACDQARLVWLRDRLPGHVPGSHISCECAHLLGDLSTGRPRIFVETFLDDLRPEKDFVMR
jgi:hypothetical protein